jgi:glycosyltransferase involved in cell wall biosynthesis
LKTEPENASANRLHAKKILLVIDSLAGGGAERVIAALAGACAEKGARVGLLTLSTPQDDHYPLSPQVERIALNEIRASRTILQWLCNNTRRFWKIRRAAQKFDPDVVVSFMTHNNVRTIAALMGTGLPVVACERIDPRRHDVGRAVDRLRRWLYPFARRVLVQTEEIAKHWACSFLPVGKVAVVPNFVRSGISTSRQAEDRDPGLILAAGRLDQQKGYDVLLAAFARAGLAARGARLVILGEGAERAALEAQTRALGLEQAVSMPGRVSDPESWMARCAMFVMSSRYEGFPNALLEAMAMGCAVLAADCDSGPRELIRHEENGLLVPVGDEEATARAMKQLFDDAALCERLGEAATEVRDRFSQERIMRRWEDVLMEMDAPSR